VVSSDRRSLEGTHGFTENLCRHRTPEDAFWSGGFTIRICSYVHANPYWLMVIGGSEWQNVSFYCI
jgi:hypothetical protein